MKLRATLTVEYDADPGDYQTYDPEEAADIDQANWRDTPAMLAQTFRPDEFKIKVEPA